VFRILRLQNLAARASLPVANDTSLWSAGSYAEGATGSAVTDATPIVALERPRHCNFRPEGVGQGRLLHDHRHYGLGGGGAEHPANGRHVPQGENGC
jgi:hypothetical protein